MTVKHGKEQVPLLKSNIRRITGLFLFLPVLLLILAVINIGIGAAEMTVLDILSALAGQGDPDQTYIILNYRMPRIGLAIMAGACLAVSGAVSQSILLNPLASPDTLGISGGAAFGAAAVTLMIPLAPTVLISAAALLGAAAATAVVYALAYRKEGISPLRLALIGVAVSACCSSLVQLLLTKEKINVNAALLWLNGSLWGRTWDQAVQALPFFLVLIPAVWLFAKVIDTLGMGDDVAKGLGLRVEIVRLLLMASAVLLAGGAIASVGMIGFVGLVSPHMARKLVGADHRLLIPASALVGALLLLLSDSLGRIVIQPSEIPAGLVTAALGAPYFLYLMWRKSR